MFLLLTAALTVPLDGPKAEKVVFSRDIRPILAENCFACHGPDARARKAGLRLDVPSKLDTAELLGRLNTEEARKRMPPAKSGKKLTAGQIELVRKWVEQGASQDQHWAFVPPVRPRVPEVRLPGATEAARSPVDRFLMARLEREKLAYSPPAARHALLRRVTLDLTGLPPTLEEYDAFLADTRPDAYQRVVERLLASPRFGEHFTRFWLDLARFGDTHGLHLDNYREMWPYRDWVIRSFNANKPYSDFVTEQLAGDLLPGAKLDHLVATGFNRAHVTTSEGGSITEELHVRNVFDRVDTFGTVMLGLSVGCAKCHDHKYDPVTMKDYYSLSAFFNSLEGSPLDGNAARHPPTVAVPTEEQQQVLARVDEKLRAARKAYADKLATLKYDGRDDTGKPAVTEPMDHVWIERSLPPEGKAEVGGFNLPWSFAEAHGRVSVRVSAPELGQVVYQQQKGGLSPGEGDRLFVHVYLDPAKPPREVMLQWHTTGWIHRAYWGENLIPWGKDSSPERRKLGPLPEKGKWVRLEVPIAEVGIKPGADILGIAFTVHGGTAHFASAGIRSKTGQALGAYPSLSAWLAAMEARGGAGLPGDVAAIVKLPAAKRTAEQNIRLRAYFIEHAWATGKRELDPLRDEVTRAESARKAIEAAMPVTYVFRDGAKRQARILKRGEYDQPGEPVSQGVPEFLNRGDKVTTRLELAQWLLREDNPLTARVAVNRLWQQIFGTGLVKTSEDLGIQGEQPSHPELLDWLAVEFRESGWDVKHLARLLVTSAAYQQSARMTEALVKLDPENRLLARGPRHRLDAEALRDQALALSGLLAERLGGPSVKPPQPPGLWRAVAYVGSNTGVFTADQGAEKVFRRGVYTFWKRTAPPPQMTIFDAPSRESCTVRRERTNTPLQALLLLNDPQYLEASRVLAQKVLAAESEEVRRVSLLFRTVTGRFPRPAEVKLLREGLAGLRAEFAKNEAGASRLIRIGETPPAVGARPGELAAWTMLASVTLNLDEALNK
jgi:hypothetical protein